VRLCDAEYASLHRFDGEMIDLSAVHGLPDDAVDVLRTIFPYRPTETMIGIARAIRERRPVHIEDLRTEPGWRFPAMQSVPEFRTLLMVPMLKDGHPVGAISVGRARVVRFTDSQVQLLQTLAD
jgi:GAF domain-containing protein